MKFYSEKLDQLFDTLEDLEAAENPKKKPTRKSTKAEPAPVETVPTVESTPEVPTKKELAAAVTDAEEKVKIAYAEYETAKARAEELSKAYLEQINSILEPAKKAVKDAEQTRYNAIKEFNKNFGAYQVTYTGERAANEMMNAINRLNSRANRFFSDLFWY